MTEREKILDNLRKWELADKFHNYNLFLEADIYGTKHYHLIQLEYLSFEEVREMAIKNLTKKLLANDSGTIS